MHEPGPLLLVMDFKYTNEKNIFYPYKWSRKEGIQIYGKQNMTMMLRHHQFDTHDPWDRICMTLCTTEISE